MHWESALDLGGHHSLVPVSIYLQQELNSGWNILRRNLRLVVMKIMIVIGSRGYTMCRNRKFFRHFFFFAANHLSYSQI